MQKKIYVIVCGLSLGIVFGIYLFFYTPYIQLLYKNILKNHFLPYPIPKHVSIGFLPYWLLDKAQTNYGDSITTLSYFGLVVGPDGHIVKLSSPTQAQPGWEGLISGKANVFFAQAKQQQVALSLSINSGDSTAITTMVENPVTNAKHLMSEVKPLMKQYGFSDLNLDVEYTQQASPAARTRFTQFVEEIRKELGTQHTLTVDVSTLDVIKQNLIDIAQISNIADYIVIMTYDYHATDSYVTGPVAPLGGAGIESEYDVTTAVQKAEQLIPSAKIIVGVPLYGYQWETLTQQPRSAIIPGTGVIASNQRVENLLSSCASCSAHFDKTAQENFVTFPNPDAQDYFQIFYPTQQSTQAKINLVTNQHLGGIALWALGYEGKNILLPLNEYLYE